MGCGEKIMLKPFEEILEPDSRFKNLVLVDEVAGIVRPLDLGDHYAVMAEITLPDNIPESVRAQFDKARNVFIYGWFDYELLSVANGFAYSALELALRIKIAGRESELGRSPGLRKLLSISVKQGWLTDERLRHVSDRPIADGFCASLPELTSNLRNEFAHGSYYVFSPGMSLMGLRISAELITLLFAPTDDRAS
jgi:hypothetical protein